MAARIFWLLLFLSLALEAMACPGCTRDRLLQSNWHVKFFVLNLVAAVGCTFNRLDAVRTMYSFIPYLTLYMWVKSWLEWYAHPVTRPEGAYGVVFGLLEAIVGLNLVGAAWLYVMGRLPFFRRDKDKGLPLWQPIAFVVSVLAGAQFI